MRTLLLLALVVLVVAGLAAAIAVPRKEHGKWKNQRDTPHTAKLRREMLKRRGAGLDDVEGSPGRPLYEGMPGKDEVKAKMMEKFLQRKKEKEEQKAKAQNPSA